MTAGISVTDNGDSTYQADTYRKLVVRNITNLMPSVTRTGYTLVLNDGLGEKYFVFLNNWIMHWDEITYDYNNVADGSGYISGCMF